MFLVMGTLAMNLTLAEEKNSSPAPLTEHEELRRKTYEHIRVKKVME